MDSDLLVLQEVLSMHCDEVGSLWNARIGLMRDAHVALGDLQRHDERIAAHLDGVLVAGEAGRETCRQLLDAPDTGVLFLLTVRTLEDDPARMEGLFDLVKTSNEYRRGLLAGFGWVDRDRLRGVVAALLRSPDPLRRLFGAAACSMHRTDPGVASRFQDEDAAVRARIFRAAGELGRHEFVSLCARSMADEDPACQFWAAWSAVLLGDRQASLAKLATLAFVEGPCRTHAFRVALLAAKVDQAHVWLQSHAADPEQLRVRLRGAGYVGDPRYIPWLIGCMSDDRFARLAGEAFTMITGVDLSRPPFERQRPDNFESGPSDDPEDDDIAMDEDDSLPWPDQSKVQVWWNQNGARFTTGVRHFIGAPPNRTHCIEVLKNGYQRQRIAAAYHLCLLNPGTPLFEWRAPAWRQQRELAQMT